MRALCLALTIFLLACADSERLPAGPGNGLPGGGSGNPGQAPPDGGGTGDTTLTGRLCRVVDLTRPLLCSPLADMSGVAVSVAGRAGAVSTAPDGSFVLEVSSAGDIVVQAAFDRPDFRPSLLRLRGDDGTDGVIVPVVDAGYFEALLEVLEVPLPQELGTLAIYPTLAGLPLSGVTIDAISSSGIFYDNGGPVDWIEASTTGLDGAALVFGVLPPAAELVAVDVFNGGDFRAVGDVPVAADAVTFVSVPFD